MSISLLVDLYRKSNKPIISGWAFSAKILFTSETIKLIDSIRSQSSARFDELLIDQVEYLETNKLPSSGKEIHYTLKLASGSADSFYNSISDIITYVPKVSRGDLPEKFYLISEDYLYGIDDPTLQPVSVNRLDNICKLIYYLSELANYHDDKAQLDYYKLVFIQPDEAKHVSPTILKTKIDESILEIPILDINLVKELASGRSSNDLHYTAKIGVFRNTLTTFLGKSQNTQSRFSFLIQNWDDFLDQYQNNLGTYLSGFAFHKAKKEVAEAEFEIAKQFSRLINEITGKLLGIPLSLAAVIAITKTNSLGTSLLLVVGLLLAAIIMSGVIVNQENQLKSIIHAKGVVLDSIEGKRDSYPPELKSAIDKMIKDLKGSEDYLTFLLKFFLLLSWLPFSIGLLIFIFSFT